MVSTRRRWRLLRPWIVKPCSRVLRKLSGELTIIQNWDARASERPDLRLRLDRPGLAGRAPAAGAVVSGVSDTTELCSYSINDGCGGAPSWDSGSSTVRLRICAMWLISWRGPPRHRSNKGTPPPG